MQGVKVLGLFMGAPAVRTNTTAAEGEEVVIEVPRIETLGQYLTTLKLSGDPGQEVWIQWPRNLDEFVNIPPSGTAIACLIPGQTYNISYVINGEYVHATTITVEPGETYEVSKPSPEQTTKTTGSPTTTTTTEHRTTTTAETPETPQPSTEGGTQWLFIAIGAVIVVAILAVIFIMRK